ncbi:MAG: twin-arginine translocation pathway signal protein [Tepidisphaeraceae bacterium]
MDQEDATVGHIYTRREALRLTASLGLGVMLSGAISTRTRAAATTQPHLPLVASPELTEGPFFVDERLNRSNLIAGSTRPAVAGGVPLRLTISLFKLTANATAPLPCVQVDLWHCDASGVYSDESNPMNHENTATQTWLRGYQVTGADGVVSFDTIVPGFYNGRAPHIHFKVRQLGGDAKRPRNEFTSQLFFRAGDLKPIYTKPPYSRQGDRPTPNEDDGIFCERLADGSRAGDALLLSLVPSADGRAMTAAFPIVLTDSSMHPARHDRGPGGPPPGDGPPPRRWI